MAIDRVLFWCAIVAMLGVTEINVLYLNSRTANPVAPDYKTHNALSVVYEKDAIYRQMRQIQSIQRHGSRLARITKTDLGKPQK